MNRKVLNSVVIVFTSFYIGCGTQPRDTVNPNNLSQSENSPWSQNANLKMERFMH